MRYCALCKRKFFSGSATTLFGVPRDPVQRANWSKICEKNLSASSFICQDHFLPSSVIHTGKNRLLLLPHAEPFPNRLQQVRMCTDVSSVAKTESNNLEDGNECSSVNTYFPPGNPKNGRLFSWKQLTKTAAEPVRTSRKENIKKKTNAFMGNHKKILKQNVLKTHINLMPPQLEEPIVHMPVVKSVSCSGITQTNIRLCGLVEASDIGDEFRFNCFYCSEVFPLEKWKMFVNHLKGTHFEEEEAFKTSEYLSKEHDYTPITPTTALQQTTFEPVTYKAEPAFSMSIDPLGSAGNHFESVVFNSNLDYTPYKTETKTNFVTHVSRKMPQTYKAYAKRKLIFSNRFHSKPSEQQRTKKSALVRCLKRTIDCELKPIITSPPEEEENYGTYSAIADQETPTEIAFEFTPRPVVNFLLDNMKGFPVLWQFDDGPFNEDFFEAVEDLCNVINDKFSLNIDNLKMRRSINRILRFYCCIFPNENNDQFTYYYNKCANFLPSVNEIAYARCSHCYVCYDSDFELQLHLVEEQKYLEWPYKCPQCRECFRLWDEFEFHKRLPHYDEIFRCQPCKMSFFRRLAYKKHMVEEHNRASEPGRFKCDICDRALETMSGLRLHKKTHGEAPHKCHLCPKTYHGKSKLELHLKIHRKEPDFMCEVCGMKFFRQPALKIHMTTHTREKVTCKICNLRLRKSSLGRHLRTVHVASTGLIASRVFNANGKPISIGRILKAKMRRGIRRKGIAERTYRCKICKEDFDSHKLIVLHNKEVHSDLPRWQCKMCTGEFSSKVNLKCHYRRKHKLHSLQVHKLVEEDEDLSSVLAMEMDEIEEMFQTEISRNNPDNTATPTTDISSSDAKPTIKTDLLPDEIYFSEEKIHSSTIQDEIMKAVDDIETQNIKIDYMDDMFTDFLE